MYLLISLSRIMREILSYFKDFWKEQNLFHLIFISLFLSFAIHLNYKYDIENGVIDTYYSTYKHFLYYFLLYSVAFIGTYLSFLYDKKGRRILKNPWLWVRIIFALTTFSLYCYFYQYRNWLAHWISDYNTLQILSICADQFFQSMLMFILLVSFWLIFDRKEQPLYGFKIHGTHYKIYLLMLLAMLPLIIAASFSPDFQSYYPTLRRILRFDMSPEAKPWYILLYELCYGQEFFHTEFFFRGFLILGFIKLAGSRAILPAAVFYCFIHFGKPAGECISSFFGGLILGILSYRSKSIIAGIIIHLGIAWLMEIIAGFWLWKSLFP